MQQLDFNTPVSRNTDPATSHDAEAKQLGKRAVRARQVLGLINKYPARTTGELARHMLRDYPELSITVCAETPHKRAADLEAKGLVAKGMPWKCTDTGYERLTWYITDAGRREL